MRQTHMARFIRSPPRGVLKQPSWTTNPPETPNPREVEQPYSLSGLSHMYIYVPLQGPS